MSNAAPTRTSRTGMDRRVLLSGLWVSILFVFAYVDILGFWRADVIEGALAGTIPGTDLAISQASLVMSTVYVLVPSLMVVASLLLGAGANRVANLIVSLLYAVSVVATVVGETWLYYVLGSVVEVVLLLAVARVAWTWRPASAVASC